MKWEDRVGRRIKLRDLHIVLAVSQEGSMSGAANLLSTSHPVVSKTVAHLEQTLGVRLFDRSVRGVAPTVYGEALAKCAKSVFDEMRQGIRQIEFLIDPSVGRLCFACPEAMAAGFVRALTEGFMKQYPGVVLDIAQAETVAAKFGMLRNRQIEFLLGRLPAPFGESDLIAESFFNETMLVVAGANSAWARRRRVRLSDLAEAEWVLPPDDSLPGQLGIELFRRCGLVPPSPKLVTLSIHLQHMAVESSEYLTLLPRSLLHFAGRRLKLRRVAVDLPPQHSAVGIVTLRGQTPSPLAKRFIDHVRTAAIPLQ